ncbi:hypothetical protein ACTT2I_05160 [Stenotrophomonas sp. PUT21]|uniref:hypothetical protein n=1 Tax=Stenotrophomonas TaxID=40323 RepID=UPI003B808716
MNERMQVGEVQGDAHVVVLREMRARLTGAGSPARTAALDAAIAALAARQPGAHPVAVLRFDRGKPGRENEMPHVISCQRLPDGEYPVYAAPPAQGIDLGQVHAAVESLLEFADHHESCGDTDTYNNAEFETCGCGFDSAREAIWNALDSQRDAAPGVGNG